MKTLIKDVSEKVTKEFRCAQDNRLLVKANVASIIESKCYKCNTLNYFNQGTSFYIDKDSKESKLFNPTIHNICLEKIEQLETYKFNERDVINIRFNINIAMEYMKQLNSTKFFDIDRFEKKLKYQMHIYCEKQSLILGKVVFYNKKVGEV